MQASKLTKRLFWSFVFLATTSAVVALAKPDGFYIDRLPKGKNVTIPRPATTFIPLSSTVKFTSTDMPQSISFKPVNTTGGQAAALRLAIYIDDAKKAAFIDLRPGTPFLYNFKTISSVTVIPELAVAAKNVGSTLLQVESDKPLEIAH
jgi:hypothetical protein